MESQELNELKLNYIDLDAKFTRDQLDVWTYIKSLSDSITKLQEEVRKLKNDNI